ncbi:MAG TPA: UvrD-helicase domain-containing protein [Clostridia bacterium]|nr:UvrD-helicase domain-containing protein [Clostridia bacterium]
MKLYCNDKIIKKIPAGKKGEVLKLLEEAAGLLMEKDRHEVLRKYNDKPMRSVDNVRKFNGPDGSRFIWKQGKHLSGARESEASDVFLLAYSTHDRQGIDAESISKDINHRNFYRIKPAGQKEFEEVRKSVRLTNRQYEISMGNLPAFISGGAGNGKTLVALHRLANINMTYPGSRTIYITLTEHLKDTAALIYGNIDDAASFDNFQTVHGLFSRLLETSGQGISYHRFKNWYSYEYGDEGEIPAIDLWTEIRGSIKGYAGDSWERNIPFDMTLISENTRNYLLDKGAINYCSDDRRTLVPGKYYNTYFDDLLKEVLSSEKNPADKALYIKDINSIRENHLNRAYEDELVSRYEYLGMDSDISRFTPKEKDFIYNIAIDYQKWLHDEGYMDDNDLALAVLRGGFRNTYDFMVIDEVQDLPEIQIKALVSLLENKGNVVFSGDVHQVLQPNSFNPTRLDGLYSVRLRADYLDVNHRSQGQIVDFTNELSGLRRSFIGSRKIESELREDSVWRSFAPFLLDYEERNIEMALRDVSRNARAAIAVADEEERRRAEAMLGPGYSTANIFTVEEIKGLEFEYVFCLNLIGSHSLHWKEIFDGNARHSGRHRYYFNTLYVAATRARETLCFCEKRSLYGISQLQQLFEKTHKVESYSGAAIGLPESFSTSEDWNIAAARLEGTRGYEKAAMYYENAGNQKASARCRILHELESGIIDDGRAASRLLDLGENELAGFYAEKAGNIKIWIRGYLRRGSVSADELEERYGSKALLEFYLDDETEKRDRDRLKEIFVIPYIESTRNELQKITGSIREFTGGRDD